MGRLEKQIIVGAIALVAVLLGVVVLTGVKPVEETDKPQNRSDWGGHGLLMESPEGDAPVKPKPELKGAGGAALSLDGPNETSAAEKAASKPEVKHTPAVQQSEPKPVAVEQQPGRTLSLDPEDQLRRYTVKSGETLSEIAMRELGSMNDLDLLMEVNEGMRKNQVRAGDVIWLPSRAAADARRADAASAAPDQAVAREASASKPSAARQGVTHEVVSGDSLWRIAEQYYGREGASTGVKRIVKANGKLSNENTVLRLGWVLSIPQ